MNTYFKCIVTSLLLFILSVTAANAQFGGMKPGGLLGGGSSGAELNNSYANLQIKFTTATSNMLLAQSITLEAYGYKEEAARFSAEAKALMEGDCDANCMKRTVQVSEEAMAKSNEALAKSAQLNAEGRALLATALEPYLNATVAAIELPAAFRSWSTQAQGSAAAIRSNPMQAAQMRGVLNQIPGIVDVTKSMPSLVSDWVEVTSKFSSYANNSGMDTSELDKALKTRF